MPNRPLVSCSVPTCPNKAVTRGRCAEHAKRYAKERPTGTRAGYGKDWRTVRDEYIAANPHCAVCGAPAEHVDHVKSRKQGGDDSWRNLQSLCATHHSEKTITENINPNPYYRGKR